MLIRQQISAPLSQTASIPDPEKDVKGRSTPSKVRKGLELEPFWPQRTPFPSRALSDLKYSGWKHPSSAGLGASSREILTPLPLPRDHASFMNPRETHQHHGFRAERLNQILPL